jgi:hypothetical protein
MGGSNAWQPCRARLLRYDQCGLQLHDTVVRARRSCFVKCESATCTASGVEGYGRRKRRQTQYGAALWTHADQEAGVLRAHGYPTQHPMKPQIGMSILLQAVRTYRETRSRRLLPNRSGSLACEQWFCVLVFVMDGLPSAVRHGAQPFDGDAGGATELTQQCFIGTTPPSRSDDMIIHAEYGVREHLQRNVRTGGKPQQPREECFIGFGFEIERQAWSGSCGDAWSQYHDVERIRQQHDGARWAT